MEWTGTGSDNRYEIDLYYCGSYCMEVRAKVIDRIQYSWLVVRACVRLAKVFSFLKIISARILNWSILC